MLIYFAYIIKKNFRMSFIFLQQIKANVPYYNNKEALCPGTVNCIDFFKILYYVDEGIIYCIFCLIRIFKNISCNNKHQPFIAAVEIFDFSFVLRIIDQLK